MSNLVTPIMLTSVENSPTVDFYPSSIRFPASPCSIINKGADQLCLNDSEQWSDLEHLVGRSNIFSTSTPNKSTQNVTHNRRLFSNNCSVSTDNTKIAEFKQATANESELSLIAIHSSADRSQVINNIWNATVSENNSCSNACVNVNMGYNDGSSIESMVSNKNSKVKPDHFVSKNIVEINNSKQIEPNTIQKTSDTSLIKVFLPPAHQTSMIKTNDQVKTFKNGSKTGHSRQWGSCGSAVTLQLNFDDKNLKSKLCLDLKPACTRDTTTKVVASRPPIICTTATTTEMRNKSFSQNNGQKRISQLSFEAEFDSEGRTHEQITIDFRKYEPYLMAGQITRIELSYFKAIKSEEFLSFKWTSMSKHTHAPGIVASTRWFNQINFWAQRIILECNELNRRTEMLTYLIRIIKKLVDCYNNLSSGMALMSALEVECIHRLKQTWNNLPNKDRATFRRMEELFSSANNYEKLRDHINSLKLPCIPYLGLYLTDLTYINVAHSKLSEFESQTKTDQINNILRTVSEFQQSEYDVSQSPLLYRYLESQRYIEELQKIIEENNYRSSMSLEPNTVESSCQIIRQQQEFPSTFNATSPQKTPPSYACKHVPNKIAPSLQSPISPKPMSSKPHNDPIRELSEQQIDNQLVSNNNDETDNDTPINDHGILLNIQPPITSGSTVVIPSVLDGKNEKTCDESLMLSSRYSDEDSVRVSLLCGAGRKSYFKKRSTSSSIRFKRDSSSSSRQQVSSKTATLSSTSQSVVSDKDLLGQHSKSLLDDSYLDATLTETCSGTVTVDAVVQGLGHGDISVVSSKQTELLCSPPICRCIIKGDVVDLKPKTSTKRKTHYSNLVNIAHAAETASQVTEKDNFHNLSNFDDSVEIILDESQNLDDKDVFKLVCQGVLSRKACMKNAKRSRFAMWNRYWMVLIISKKNAFLVFFENSHFRALERKDFKSKKCHVQDLKNVTVSRVRPTLDKNISERKVDSSPHSSVDSDVSRSIKKFFLVDKEYGLVYKFRDPSKSKATKERKSPSDTDNEQRHCLQESPANDQMPSVTLWYRLLKRSIRRINRPLDDHKDLIVLSDS